MKNVEDILRNWIKGDHLGLLTDFLRSRDPEFAVLEGACANAPEALLAVRCRQVNVGLAYAFWQGLQLNLENFRGPVGNVLQVQDLSQLVREHILFSLPAYSAAQQELALVECGVPDEMLVAVNEFYTYLETVGLKVAHYLGFRQGDLLFPIIEPGYVPDTAATQTYRMELEKYLGFPLN